MSSVAEQVAAALGARAIELAGQASERPSFVVELPDGRVPVLVRSFVHGVGVCVDATQSWTLTPGVLDDATREAIVAASRTWAESRASHVISLFELALRVTTSLTNALDQHWTASFPGTAAPREAWLHGPDFDAAAVGVFAERVLVDVAGKQHSWTIRTGEQLERHNPAIIAAVRRQLAGYATNVELSARVQACAEALATKLGQRLGLRCAVEIWARPSHWRPIEAWLRDGGRDIACVCVEDGQVVVHAGLADDRGWDGHDIDGELEAIVAAIELAARSLTIDRLAVGARYRVIADIGELRAGMIVTLVGFDDIDNHYGVYQFTGPDGQTLGVGGDYSTPRNSPLGPAYRYLEPVEPIKTRSR